MVTALIAQHNCSSSARRLTTTPTAAWVASRGIKHHRKDPNMGPKELKKQLQDYHKCEIHYDTICKGRQIAMKELFGSWEESFQMLYNWRAEVLKHSPNSVIEIDIKMVDGKMVWTLSSSHLNGWCGHLAELGHGETRYKCRLNGTKKRKRKPRTNTTKYGKNGNNKTKKAAENTPVKSENAAIHAENAAVQPENAAENTPVQAQNVVVHPENTPVHAENVVTAKTNILATSPERLTRSRLAVLLGEGPSTLLNHLSPNKQATTSPKPRKKATNSPKKGIAKKLIPRKLKTN